MSKYMKQVTAAVLVAASFGPVAGHAETIGEVLERQRSLADLDHRIERNERLIKLQEQRVEFQDVSNPRPERNDRRQQNQNAQTQYFGQQPGMQAENGQNELVIPEKTPEQQRRERVLSALDGAVLAEAYLPKTGSSVGLIGVVAVDGQSYQVRKGSVIDGWKATSVQLDRIVFENEEFDVKKTVFQAR